MSRLDELLHDPVIEEIDRIRERLWREAGGTLSRYIQMARGWEKAHPQRRTEQAARPQRLLPPPRNPVIEEIHRIRDQMWKEAGGTLEGFADLVRRRAESARPLPSRGRGKKQQPKKAAKGKTRSASAKVKSPTKRRKPAGRNRSKTA